MFPIYRLIMKVNPQEVNRLTEIVNEIRKLFGQSIVEFSELKQEKAVQKLMYLQINFKHFSDLVRFYSILMLFFVISFLCFLQVTQFLDVSISGLNCLL